MVEIVAEIACSHNGNYKHVIRMIEVAKEAGADSIQLQIFTKNLPEIQFSIEEWKEIISTIDREKLKLYFTPYDIDALFITIQFNPDGYKIHGCVYDNFQLINTIQNEGKPIHLMVGGKTIPQIGWMIHQLNTDITLLYGIQLFPTPIHATNLGFFNTLRETFPSCKLGLADHIDGYSDMAKVIPAMSLSYGVNVIEKHLTLERKGYDWEGALLPADFRQFVDWTRKAEEALGNRTILTKEEKLYQKYCDDNS